MNPKFKKGDKIIVCQDLITTIESIQPIEDGSWIYWFKDENGADKFENDHAIELYSGKVKQPHSILSIGEISDQKNQDLFYSRCVNGK